MSKLLLADDDGAVCETVSNLLRRDNYIVDVANDGEEALEFLHSFKYALVILDWEMPEYTGREVCEKHRQSGGHTPILMLTGKTDIESKVEALDAGADDYLTKPFHYKELAARLRALIRRPQTTPSVKLSIRNIELDPATGKVFQTGAEIHLQPIEYSVLEFFLRNPGKIFSTDELLNRIWDSDTSVSTECIYSCLRRIRRKLDTEDQPTLIRNVHGRGYILDE